MPRTPFETLKFIAAVGFLTLCFVTNACVWAAGLFSLFG